MANIQLQNLDSVDIVLTRENGQKINLPVGSHQDVAFNDGENFAVAVKAETETAPAPKTKKK